MKFDIKIEVKEYYGAIAQQVNLKGNKSCCGTTGLEEITNSNKIYQGQNLQDIPKEAIEASLGCANPLLFAKLQEGETVLDLGSGAGIDVFLSAKYVGETGKVYGLDMTDEMLDLANKNKEQIGVNNVEFLKGYIEEIPLEAEKVDVIMSNCVINLCEDKTIALTESYRVLKSGGRLAIADIVNLREVPKEILQIAQVWVGCIGGALKVDEYKHILDKAGFKDITITPAHIYTKTVLEELIKTSGFQLPDPSVLDIVDGAFAGAFITANK
jgi:arsenite methyltransferase